VIVGVLIAGTTQARATLAAARFSWPIRSEVWMILSFMVLSCFLSLTPSVAVFRLFVWDS
jgi:hypothetical protein